MQAHRVVPWFIAAFAIFMNEPVVVNSEILTPPYFNLAEGKKITATATCGEDTEGPELYCKLVGTKSDTDTDVNVIQGQFCDVCDPNKPDRRHPPEYAVDGMETWWQSPPLSRGMKYNKVNLTIELGQEFHVAYVYIRMGNSPRPGLWVLEKSADYGKTYTPWQYFSDSQADCETHFGVDSLQPITRDDSIICTTEYSNILPLEGGEIPISLLINRPSSKDYFNSTVLQEWTRATNVRLRLLRTKNFLGHLMSVARQDPTVTRRYFYSIKDISIGGRCMCNGHADTCDIQDPNNPSILLCRCQHNTCGAKCDTCCPGFVQKAWRQSKVNEPFICEPCNCFQHSRECSYDSEVDKNHLSLDIYGKYEGGGVCQNCQHNTMGINCNKCLPKFYRPFSKQWNETDVCQRCDCDNFYSTGNCSEGTGKCECRKEFNPPDCDTCSFGYYGYPNCKPCECFLNGTTDLQCAPEDGKCTCLSNFGGVYCKECAQGFYDFPECRRCECNPEGSLSPTCNMISGNCTCKNNYGGQHCDSCQNGFYNFPTCSYCNCDLKGTKDEICDKNNGQCICREEFTGERCDRCKAGYYGYPNCQPCNCGMKGSLGKTCSEAGKCSCLVNYAGRTCEQCSPGYYNYTECASCECDSRGSNGISCDNDGKCECHFNFDGKRCDMCKEGFYNFPVCEDCNCHPAGVVEGFAGCGSVPAGELCQCKERVEGRICNKCKPMYWNLNPNNPAGCEECNCNPSGVLGGIKVCESDNGQCVCKPSVISRSCSECADGSYRLEEDNLFGCQDCGCDVGGSITNICDKSSGQCVCQARVTGRTCKEPLSNHYFPTLYQYQYEVEDGQTPGNTSARYSYDERVFPGYSWKGYGVFSAIQNEILQEIYIAKSSLYLMILKYVNMNSETIIGTIRIIPESYYEIEQKQEVHFKENREPAFVTVSGATGSTPTPFVINPGKWTVSIKVPKGLFVDYFVLLPEDYYLASILHHKVEKPCTLNDTSLCREYSYPNLTNFDTIGFGFGTAVLGNTQQPIMEFYEDQTHLPRVHVKNRIPLISSTQPAISIDLPVNKPGAYVLIINYITPQNDPRTHKLDINVTNDVGTAGGRAILYSCVYTLLCRQVVTNEEDGVGIFHSDGDHLTIDVEGRHANVALHSITAIPQHEWSLDYNTPRPKCIIKDGHCIQSTFRTPQETKKIVFEQMDNEVTKLQPPIPMNTTYVLLNSDNQFVDLRGKVPSPGYYTFLLHYHQPYFPEFKINVIIQNGQFYEATVSLMHCPSQSGCRAVVYENNGNYKFNLIENFIITFKDPGNKTVNLFYLLVVPSDFHTPQNLEEEDFDQTGEFIKTCAKNNFNIDTNQQGFCRDSVFSITAAHNDGARPCQCNFDGSTSFTCDKFGGQCPCKENVIGRRCEACKTGYYGFPNCKPCNCPSTAYCDPNDGRCICPPRVTGERCDQCEPLTYGYDPIIGCEECNCNPLGIERTLQCDILNGSCSCKPNIDGRRCDHCLPGYYTFPFCESCECDTRGTIDKICDQETAECLCKKHVIGPGCEQCKDGTFNLEANNENGCTECFCFGKTKRCDSSQLIMISLIDMSDWNLLELNFSTKLEKLNYNLTLQTGEKDVGVDFTQIDKTNQSFYFSAPSEYLGSKLRSYGGFLNYTIFYTIDQIGSAVSGADVILEGNDIYLTYSSLEQPPQAQEFSFNVQFVESNFNLPFGGAAKREHIMEVLRELKGVYIRAKYWTASVTSRLTNVSQDEAISYEFYSDHNRHDIRPAKTIEECHCPPNYQGLSCEECSPGYYRIPGPHGGYCVQCQCNGHSNLCDVNTGVCLNCTHHTVGDHCEKCEEGYHGNANGGTPTDCLICACPLPIAKNNFATSCDVSSDGEKISCECKEGYLPPKCDACASGFYGNPKELDDFCKPCQCSGNINPKDPNSCDTVSGECLKCLNNTFGVACALCAPGYFGDAITSKDCQACICDKLGTDHCNSYTGECVCKPNVEGEKCDRCKYEHFGFQSGKGCQACSCKEASESNQCDDITGLCKCKPGVAGRTCDRCAAGHWNYTADGCDSCGCKSDYSVGFGCNALTGQCECLQGVMGEKCDKCPYRWAFVPDYGCHECDSCTHALLNTTDELTELIDPVILEFNNTHSGYFTLKKLDNLREFLNELKPKFDEVDPEQLSLNSSMTELESLEALAKNLNRKANFSLENGESLKKDADTLKLNAEKLLADLRGTEESAESAISKINNIVIQLNEGSGPTIEAAINQGEEILKSIKMHNLSNWEETAANQLQKASDLMSDILNFKLPGDNLVSKTDLTEEGLKNFTLKLDDLYNNTQYSMNKANEAEQLLKRSGIDSLKRKFEDIYNQTARMTQNLGESVLLNRNSSYLLVEAKKPLTELLKVPNEIGELLTPLNQTLERNERSITDIENLLPAVEKHANQTSDNLQELESFLTETQYLSGDAVKAANAYKDILQTVQNARKAAVTADEEAIIAVNSLDGIDELMFEAEQNSSSALSKAHDLHSSTKENLAPLLQDAKNKYEPVSKLHGDNKNKLDDLEKKMQNIATLSFDEVYKNATTDSQYASARIQEVILNTDKYFAELEQHRKEANALPKELDQTTRNIQQTEKQLNSINDKLPLLIDTINSLPEKQKKLQLITEHIRQNIDKLNQQVAFARDLANRIDVGVTFYPNTTLELRNPPVVDSLTTSTTISGFFKTDKPDGLIFYLGNPVGTALPRTSTDDYLALVIQNGYPVLKLDLGNGNEQVINEKFVADNIWYQFIIIRTGNNAKLIIREEKSDGQEAETTNESILEGPLSILNLDRNKSKLFVGGIPVNYHIQDAIEVNSFDGEIEELVIGDTPVSMWNFNNGYENNHGCIRRNKLLNVQPATGLRFNGNGYAVFNARSYNLRRRSDIQLKFKTFATEGLLFLAEKDNTFISLELRNGKILYQYNLGHTTKLWHTSKMYNDGQWHTVSATREGPRGQLTVDSENVSDRTKSIDGNVLSSIEIMSFGGYPGKHNLTDVTAVKFDGCIESAIVMGNSIDFKQNIRAYDITPGCPQKVAKLVSFMKNRPGYIRHSPLSVSNNFRMNLNFKTTQPDGIIFYGTNQEQSDGISLSLKDGQLVLISQKIEHRSKDIFNDNTWHVISIMHNNHELRIDFDDYEYIVTDSPPTSLHILYGNLYIGGVPQNFITSAGMVGSDKPFVGCIADVTLNGNVINFANTTDKKNEIFGKCVTDMVHWEENPDVHHVPTLPPLDELDKENTIYPDQITDRPHGESTTIRGDGGYEEPVEPLEPLQPIPATERPVTLPPPTEAPIQTIEPETEKSIEVNTGGPVGTAHIRTTAPPKQGCALPLNPNTDDSSLDPNSFRFGTQAESRLEFNSARGRFKKSSDYHLEFKTGETSGILFYISDQSITHDAYMAVLLQDGHVVFTFSNKSGAAIIKSSEVYNDDNWHNLDFTREGSNGKLIIDGKSENFGTAVDADKLELKLPFYIGGLDPSDYNTVYGNLNTTTPFKGCIRNFLMHGRPMINPKRIEVIPCSDNVESGTFFYGTRGSYIKLRDKFFVGQTFSVKLDIKPRIDTGILISVHGKKDYFVLEMVNGSMKLTAENGLGPITAIFEPKTPYYFCDGHWHNIQAVKSKNIVTLSVDNIFTEPKLGDHRAVSTSTGGTLFLGGHKFLGNVKRLRGLSSNQAYVGCIKNVYLNNDLMPLTPSMKHGNVIVGACRTN